MKKKLEQIADNEKIPTKHRWRWTKDDYKVTGEIIFYFGLMVGGYYIGSKIGEPFLGTIGGGVLASLIQDEINGNSSKYDIKADDIDHYFDYLETKNKKS